MLFWLSETQRQMKFFRHLCSIVLGIGILAFGGCSAVSPGAENAASEAALARSAFPGRLAEVRTRAWQTALEIISVYENIPADRCPGIAALVQDVRAAELQVGSAETRNLDRLDAKRLVSGNPNFWRAALEISPSDGSLLLLEATLLASAGEVWRANRILVATTQLLPIPAGIRPYFLAHSYSLGSVIVMAVRAAELDAESSSPAAAKRRFEDALNEWPKNAVALSELIDAQLRSRVAARSSVPRDQIPAFIDEALTEFRSDVDRLYVLDPLSAAPYRGTPENRRAGRRLRVLWARLSDNDSALGYKEIGELAQAVETADDPELALVLFRIQVVARGFPGPSDAAAWRRLLPKLISPASSVDLLSAADRGEINVVEITPGASTTLEEWKGDPAIHPLVMQQVQREVADLTFQIDVLQEHPEAQAQALRRRGVQYSRAGLYDHALSDLEAATQRIGREPAILLDQAIVYASTERESQAEKLLQEVESTRSGKALAARERGLFRFGQGRFQEARDALLADLHADPKSAYSAIMTDLAGRRLGRSEPAVLSRARQSVKPGSWPDLCLAFLSGKISDDVLLREAQQGDNLEVAQRLCEAYFILAEVALASSNQAKGIDFLESCIGTGITGFVEFRLARIELKKLAPERESRTRRWEERSPHDAPRPSQPKEKKSLEEELFDSTVPA